MITDNRINKYGKFWNQVTPSWFIEAYNKMPQIHDRFQTWTSNKNFNSILEVGSGHGFYVNYFNGCRYTGIEFDKKITTYAIKHNTNKSANFINADFLSIDIPFQYDLVFSHSVADHVPDIDKFFKKCITLSTKY